MKPSIQSRLEQLVERFEEVNALLSDASVIANQDKFRDLSREFAEIEPVVKCFGTLNTASSLIEKIVGITAKPIARPTTKEFR